MEKERIKMRKGQLRCGEQATVTTCQHKTPCVDCPWSKESLPGWLGSNSIGEWLAAAHGDGTIECHTKKKKRGAWQCAGAAIYRANVAKLPIGKNLILKRDKD